MKKKTGAARAVAPVPRDRLASMPARALLARLQRFRRCEESHEFSDLADDEVHAAEGMILFRRSDTRRQARTDDDYHLIFHSVLCVITKWYKDRRRTTKERRHHLK